MTISTLRNSKIAKGLVNVTYKESTPAHPTPSEEIETKLLKDTIKNMAINACYDNYKIF